jgi:hypothetical protein
MTTRCELQDKRLAPFGDYLHQIEAQLETSGVNAAAGTEILAELKSHLADRVIEFQAEGSIDPVGQAIAALGSPSAIGSEFAAISRIRVSARSFSPIRLLSTVWNLCRALGRGFGLFVSALAGYALTIGAMAAAVLKVILPAKIGFWVGSNGMVWGLPPEGAVARELAGNWFIAISLWVAIFIGVSTTFLVARAYPALCGLAQARPSVRGKYKPSIGV